MRGERQKLSNFWRSLASRLLEISRARVCVFRPPHKRSRKLETTRSLIDLGPIGEMLYNEYVKIKICQRLSLAWNEIYYDLHFSKNRERMVYPFTFPHQIDQRLLWMYDSITPHQLEQEILRLFDRYSPQNGNVIDYLKDYLGWRYDRQYSYHQMMKKAPMKMWIMDHLYGYLGIFTISFKTKSITVFISVRQRLNKIFSKRELLVFVCTAKLLATGMELKTRLQRNLYEISVSGSNFLYYVSIIHVYFQLKLTISPISDADGSLVVKINSFFHLFPFDGAL